MTVTRVVLVVFGVVVCGWQLIPGLIGEEMYWIFFNKTVALFGGADNNTVFEVYAPGFMVFWFLKVQYEC